MPKLIISLPDGSESVHELAGEALTIGREADNTIHLDNPSVSGHHAQIALAGKHYELRDLNSTNGTRVNGEVFSKGQLMNGDKIRFGDIEASYVSSDPSEARPMPEAVAVSHKVAETSQRPANFSNVSSFKVKRKPANPAAQAVMGLAALAFLGFLAAVVSILMIQPPR
jgi:pSer/pThr/pTyr-binding forkhead associated (FHA) protein